MEKSPWLQSLDEFLYLPEVLRTHGIFLDCSTKSIHSVALIYSCDIQHLFEEKKDKRTQKTEAPFPSSELSSVIVTKDLNYPALICYSVSVEVIALDNN